MTRTSRFAPPRAAAAAPLLAALSFFVSACGAEPRGSPAPALLSDPGRYAVHVGLDESGSPAGAAIGRVVAARVTDGARHVVVLDFVAPYVKVFDGNGRFQTAFVRQGGGPGEARRPSAMAAAGDSLVLVADGTQSLAVFDLAGTLRTQASVPGLLALSAAAACPGEWLIYGPRRDPSVPRGRVTWLHRVRFTGPGRAEVRSFVPDTIADRMGTGLPYGLVPDGGGAVVRHSLGARPQVLRLDCAGGEPRVLHQGQPPAPPDESRDGGRVRTSLTPGMRAPGGVAALEGGVVFGEKVLLGHGRHRLDLTLLGQRGERTLSIEGDYVLEDSRPGVGVLLSTSDPVPQVFLVRPREFLAMFPAR